MEISNSNASQHFQVLKRDLLPSSEGAAAAPSSQAWADAAAASSLRASQARRHSLAASIVASAFEPELHDRFPAQVEEASPPWAWNPQVHAEYPSAASAGGTSASGRPSRGLSEWRMRHAAAFSELESAPVPVGLTRGAEPFGGWGGAEASEWVEEDGWGAAWGAGYDEAGQQRTCRQSCHYTTSAGVGDWGDDAGLGGPDELSAAHARLAEASRALGDAMPSVGAAHPHTAQRIAAQVRAAGGHARSHPGAAGLTRGCPAWFSSTGGSDGFECPPAPAWEGEAGSGGGIGAVWRAAALPWAGSKGGGGGRGDGKGSGGAPSVGRGRGAPHWSGGAAATPRELARLLRVQDGVHPAQEPGEAGWAGGWHEGDSGFAQQLVTAARRERRHACAAARSRYGAAFPIPAASEKPPSAPSLSQAARPRSAASPRGHGKGAGARSAMDASISEAAALDRLAEAMRALGAPPALRPEVARLLGLHRPARPTCYKVVAHLQQAELGLRPGFYSLDGRLEYRLGQTSTIEGERAVGRRGEEGSGGFFVWRSVQEALAATFSPGARLFEAPRALLRVYCGGAERALPADARFAALVDGRQCFPLVTPVSVVAKGRTLLGLYQRFLDARADELQQADGDAEWAPTPAGMPCETRRPRRAGSGDWRGSKQAGATTRAGRSAAPQQGHSSSASTTAAAVRDGRTD